MDDRELNHLLGEWKAPDAPAGLRPPRARLSPLSWLVRGSIAVPVPVAAAAVLLVAAWVTLIGPQLAPASTPPSPQRNGELARYPLTGRLEGFDAVLVGFNFAPGAPSRPHRHPGFVLGYVIDGQLKTAIDGGQPQVVPAGSTFFEPEGAVHTAFGTARDDARARAVAFLVVPRGSALAVPHVHE
jgi:quercetin dioxygenase-like cupin family protein